MPLFSDRRDAGRQLAAMLTGYAEKPNAIVLGLPRGGIPVAYEVAKALKLPLDVYSVRKIGVPGHEELAMGAVASDGTCVVDRETMALAQITPAEFAASLARERTELKRRELAYRDDRPEPDVGDKTVILVDDGLATGASMLSAIAALRERGPAEIVVAVPVAARDSLRSLEGSDRVVTVYQPEPFVAVGIYYADFRQVDDEEVKWLLGRSESEMKRWSLA